LSSCVAALAALVALLTVLLHRAPAPPEIPVITLHGE
jgi:hypothetical protein